MTTARYDYYSDDQEKNKEKDKTKFAMNHSLNKRLVICVPI